MSLQTYMSCFLMFIIKEDISKNADNQIVNGPHWIPLHFFPYYRSQFSKILQNIFICVQKKKETYTGLERREGQ